VFGMGGSELLIVFVIILLVFGPSQIPKMARGLGQAMREFRKAQNEISDELRADDTNKANKPPENKPVN
jgi:TatA/E family protein of Tat protein translocase